VSLQGRQDILKGISEHTKTPVLALVNGDRENLATVLAQDVIPLLPRHLEANGVAKSMTVLLYTRGGDTNTPWPVVSFIREYCQELDILVPFWAHSAGTLLCLGADRVFMSRFATVSPIDPTVANQFNPQDPVNPQNRFPIAVEDVLAYFELAEERGASAGTEAAGQVFLRMANEVHPLALGNVKRSINQIRQLAKKMIRLHMTDPDDDHLERIVKGLTTEFYSHNHFIGRKEAAEMGLPVHQPDDTLEGLMLDYYAALRSDLVLDTKFDPAAELRAAAGQGQHQVAVVLERCYVETPTTSDAFVTDAVISQQAQMLPGVPQGVPAPVLPAIATVEVISEGWRQLV
jgi:hypothetical protein